MKLQIWHDHLWNIFFQIFFIILWQYNFFNTCPVCCKYFFLHPADFQNSPAKCNLAGHGDHLSHRLFHKSWNNRGCHRSSCRWSVFGYCSFWNMHMHVNFLIKLLVESQRFPAASYIGKCCLSRFFHNIPQLPCKNQRPAARHKRYLDKKYVSARLCPCHTGRHADFIFNLCQTGGKFIWT